MEQIKFAAQAPATLDSRRYNIYAIIHKGLRLFLSDTLAAVGNMDTEDPASVERTLAQVRDLAQHCESHFQHENSFLHTAMEARRPGSSCQAVEEHEHHAIAVEQLRMLATGMEQAVGAARCAAAARLYHYLALFVADNFTHMHHEESEHNAVLWATHTDEELQAIEQLIVASIPPEEAMAGMRWMLAAMNSGERAVQLEGMRRHAPPPVFDAVMSLARAHLPEMEWRKLLAALAMPERCAA